MELLIARNEITCLILLASFSAYYLLIDTKDRQQKIFLRLSSYAMGHILFGIITIYTVNNMDVVPDIVNRICHVIFFLMGIMTHVELFKFLLKKCFPASKNNIWNKIVYVPVIIYVICTFILPVEYNQGNGTMYSYGTLVFIAYGISLCMSLTCTVIYFVRWKYIEFEVKYTVVPMSIIMFVCIIIQAFIPEVLMTGAGLCLVCIGIFFTLDNPIEMLKQQAYWDKGTKIKNRNCYEIDLKNYSEKYKNIDMDFGVLVADVNYLKVVNDQYGHGEGDRVLRTTANLLKEKLKYAEDIYRIGGDEFIAFYFDAEDEIIENDMNVFWEECKKVDDLPIPLSVALGYSCVNLKEKTIQDAIEHADGEMYKIKAKMHEKK